MPVGGEIGADLVEIAQRHGAEARKEPGAAILGITRLGMRRRAGTTEAEVGLMRHQEGDKADPEKRAKKHAGHPISCCLRASMHARL